MRRPAFALAVLTSLAFAGPVAAHVGATPAYLAAGSSDTIHLDVPNERNEPMTGFTVTVPDGFEIVHAHPSEGWSTDADDTTATWTGGSVPASASATFELELSTPSEPAVVALDVEQHYDGGEVVRWPVAFTVTPAAESSSRNLALLGFVGLFGVLVVAGIAAFAWRRRASSLQER